MGSSLLVSASVPVTFAFPATVTVTLALTVPFAATIDVTVSGGGLCLGRRPFDGRRYDGLQELVFRGVLLVESAAFAAAFALAFRELETDCGRRGGSLQSQQ